MFIDSPLVILAYLALLRWRGKATLPPRGSRLKQRRWITVLVLGSVAAYAGLAGIALSFDQHHHSDASMTRSPSTMILTLAWAPLFEELLYRGILLGRLYRIAGWPIALVVSSALFGLAHVVAYEGDIDKIWRCTRHGVVYGGLYLLSGSLWAPIAAHCFWNLRVNLRRRPSVTVQPWSSDEEIEQTLRSSLRPHPAWVLCMQRAVIRVVEGGVSVLGLAAWNEADCPPALRAAWLTPDLQQLSPEARAFVQQLFIAVHGSAAGSLSLDEVAWLWSLQHKHRIQLSYALAKMQQLPRQQADLFPRKDALYLRRELSTLTTAPRSVPCSLQCGGALASSLAAVGPDWAALQLETINEFSASDASTVSYLFRNYSSMYWRVFSESHFGAPPTADAVEPSECTAAPTGCTLERFERWLVHQLVAAPCGTISWFSRAEAVLRGEHEHPPAGNAQLS